MGDYISDMSPEMAETLRNLPDLPDPILLHDPIYGFCNLMQDGQFVHGLPQKFPKLLEFII